MKYAKVVVDIKADFADRLYTYLAGDLKLSSGAMNLSSPLFIFIL